MAEPSASLHEDSQRTAADEARSNENFQSSIEEVWYLKEISFRHVAGSTPKRYKIITQNFNGPCSFIAICNILILRERIQLLPFERSTVSYDYLSQLVAEYLLTAHPDVDISAALSIMPATRKGMDLNPLFTGATSFRPAGVGGGELKLFEQAGIKLVHGWLVDPSSAEYKALSYTQDYDSSVNLLVEVDHLTKGQFVVSEEEPSSSQGPSRRHSTYNLTPEEQQKVENALIVRNFIETSSSQLTYFGLFELASSLEPNSLAALFRNSHLAVLYKSSEDDGSLYTLVTDQVFLHEPSVVWERVEDIDGSYSTFVDSDFVRSSPAGGDFAGHTAESALAALEQQTGALTLADRADETLARQLQDEENARLHDHYARQDLARLEQERDAERGRAAERERELKERGRQARERTLNAARPKKKSDCIIM